MQNSIVIVAVGRTPQGKLLGCLKSKTAVELGAAVINGVLRRSGLAPAAIQEVIMGCVLPAGLGQAPARQAALGAGLLAKVQCTTVNKVCGSGMKAVLFAHDGIVAGSNQIYIAGGMESMTNAPYLIPKARGGYRFGHGQLLDHMVCDGLEDAYKKNWVMGQFADECAREYGFTREIQDQFAMESLQRAQQSIFEKRFVAEIIPITLKDKSGDVVIDTDEHPTSVKIEKIPLLRPAFNEDGTVTAANSSAIADGAAAIVLMQEAEAQSQHIKPIARIVGHSTHAKLPHQFTTAPIGAISKLLEKIKWNIADVDLFEINEAFAVVPLAAMHDLKIPHEKLNINGGGCALGHPIGASGARIIVTLVSALIARGLKKGIASLCIGGGEATAIAVEIY